MFQISLKAARVNAGLNQSEAAKRIGVTAKTLRHYENGVTAIPGWRLRKAASIYGISEDRIRVPIVHDGKYDEEDEKNLCNTTV